MYQNATECPNISKPIHVAQRGNIWMIPVIKMVGEVAVTEVENRNSA